MSVISKVLVYQALAAVMAPDYMIDSNTKPQKVLTADLTNIAKQPVKSTYGSKQRKRKAKRKGIK